MSEDSPYQIIDEEQLSVSEYITLTTELVRIIEKEIDDEKSRNVRQGWSTWAILGGIVGAALILFGQTRDLAELPVKTVEIGAVSLLSIFFLFGLFNSLSGNPFLVKTGRLTYARDAFRGQWFLIILRLLLFLAISMIVGFADFGTWPKVLGIVLILLPTLFFFFSFTVAAFVELPIGNNPQKSRTAPGIAFIALGFYFVAIVLLGSQLPFPIGASLTSAYLVSISLSVIVALFEWLLWTAIASRGIPELNDLKDDLVFQRVGLNEGLNRYKVIKEGRTLFEEMKPDLDTFLSNMYQQEEIYNDQIAIIKKFKELLPVESDSEETMALKQNDAEILHRSAQISREKLISLSKAISFEIPAFNKKLVRVANATGDFDTKQIIDDLRNRRFQDLVQKENELNALSAELEQYIQSERGRLKGSEANVADLKPTLPSVSERPASAGE